MQQAKRSRVSAATPPAGFAIGPANRANCPEILAGRLPQRHHQHEEAVRRNAGIGVQITATVDGINQLSIYAAVHSHRIFRRRTNRIDRHHILLPSPLPFEYIR